MFNTSVNTPELIQCYDHINNRNGNEIIGVAAAGPKEKWLMRRKYLSPGFVHLTYKHSQLTLIY